MASAFCGGAETAGLRAGRAEKSTLVIEKNMKNSNPPTKRIIAPAQACNSAERFSATRRENQCV
jgi:hypothetical protein